MIEMRTLAYFVETLRAESLTAAAETLGIALSTLSAALSTFERDVGTALFRRADRGLAPTADAPKLARLCDDILYAETFARRWSRAAPKTKLKVLTIEIRIGHTIGGIGRILRQAVATCLAHRADVFVRVIWAEDEAPAIDPDLEEARVIVDFADTPGSAALFDDRWVFACRLPPDPRARPRAAALLAGRVVVPRLPPALHAQISRYLDRYDIARVRFAEDPPSELPRLLSENPDAALLLPGLMAAPHLGAPQIALVPVDDALFTGIFAQATKVDATTRMLLQHLRRAFAEPARMAPERPEISLKQIGYFNAVHRIRRISSAARSVNISQPALSEQIRKLETTAGTPLFARSGGGVVPTLAGERFAEIAQGIERTAKRISTGGRVAAAAGRRVAIGILPTVNQHGYLVNRVAEALLDAQAHHPAIQIDVQEAPNGTLQEWVMRGIVGVAIVETGLPHVPRLPLGSSEALAVIADPRFALLPAGPLTMAEAAALPLILPTARSGLRQLVDAAARARGLTLKPQMEIGGLAMTVAILARRPVCTMLPPSAVLREIESGDLVARDLVDPVIERRLFVIHSAERALSAPERDIVRLLREKLAAPMPPAFQHPSSRGERSESPGPMNTMLQNEL